MLNKKLAKSIDYFDTLDFEKMYCYDGELGYVYTKEKTIFKVWSPVAKKISVKIYSEGMGDNLISKTDMLKMDKGLWQLEIEEDLEDKFYTYELEIDNLKKNEEKKEESSIDYIYTDEDESTVMETPDIYGKACGVNGLRTMIVDMKKTNPKDWSKDKKPEFNDMLDAILYEVHIRDFSSDDSCGMGNRRKYLAFTENGTHNDYGMATGVEHLKELGITHVHLLPMQDYVTVDERECDPEHYNWGYDPLNYYIPEGSYATDAFDGKVRIREFKELVKSLHDNGIRVVMDVVYNHTYSVKESLFNRLVPNYYYRIENNKYTDGSACGNETASDHYMFRKYMIDSLKYWIEEYHIDGFRFDLMAVHDIETINKIRLMADEIDTSIILYGEGWKGGYSKLDPHKAAFKLNASKVNMVAMFNDDGRDAVKGSVFIADKKGFATGAMYDNKVKNKKAINNKIKYFVAGSGEHSQVNTVSSVDNPMWGLKDEVVSWADEPYKTINYVSAHDNLTLWDKILVSNKSEDLETKKQMNKLSMAIVMLSQGIPFIHAGDEFLRSKKNANCSLGYDDNSYVSSDEVNSIKWNDKHIYEDVFNYYKGLIAFRKATKELKLRTRSEIDKLLKFRETEKEDIIIYSIGEAGDVIIGFNGSKKDYSMELPEGKWNVYIDDNNASDKALKCVSESIVLKGLSAVALKKD